MVPLSFPILIYCAAFVLDQSGYRFIKFIELWQAAFGFTGSTFFYFNFSDFCSCPYCLFPCPTLDLICSSFLKMFLRLKFRPLTWDIFSFFNISIYAIDFHLSTIWAASHKFWHVFLFSFSLKYLIISFLGGFLTHKLFRSVLFNFQIFQNFLYIFNLWFLV